MDVPSYDEMWVALLNAGVQISEIQRCIEWHTGQCKKVSNSITNEELENFWSKIPTTKVSVDDEDFDGEKWGLTPAFQIAGFD